MATSTPSMPVLADRLQWLRALFSRGFDPRLPTLFVVEGVFMYISTAQVEEALGLIASLSQMNPLSTTIADVYSSKTQMSGLSYYALFRSGLDRTDVPDFLRLAGFTQFKLALMGQPQVGEAKHPQAQEIATDLATLKMKTLEKNDDQACDKVKEVCDNMSAKKQKTYISSKLIPAQVIISGKAVHSSSEVHFTQRNCSNLFKIPSARDDKTKENTEIPFIPPLTYFPDEMAFIYGDFYSTTEISDQIDSFTKQRNENERNIAKQQAMLRKQEQQNQVVYDEGADRVNIPSTGAVLSSLLFSKKSEKEAEEKTDIKAILNHVSVPPIDSIMHYVHCNRFKTKMELFSEAQAKKKQSAEKNRDNQQSQPVVGDCDSSNSDEDKNNVNVYNENTLMSVHGPKCPRRTQTTRKVTYDFDAILPSDAIVAKKARERARGVAKLKAIFSQCNNYHRSQIIGQMKAVAKNKVLCELKEVAKMATIPPMEDEDKKEAEFDSLLLEEDVLSYVQLSGDHDPPCTCHFPNPKYHRIECLIFIAK